MTSRHSLASVLVPFTPRLRTAHLSLAQGFAAMVSPPRFELMVKPGETQRQIVEITNADSRPATFRLRTADWTLDAKAAVAAERCSGRGQLPALGGDRASRDRRACRRPVSLPLRAHAACRRDRRMPLRARHRGRRRSRRRRPEHQGSDQRPDRRHRLRNGRGRDTGARDRGHRRGRCRTDERFRCCASATAGARMAGSTGFLSGHRRQWPQSRVHARRAADPARRNARRSRSTSHRGRAQSRSKYSIRSRSAARSSGAVDRRRSRPDSRHDRCGGSPRSRLRPAWCRRTSRARRHRAPAANGTKSEPRSGVRRSADRRRGARPRSMGPMMPLRTTREGWPRYLRVEGVSSYFDQQGLITRENGGRLSADASTRRRTARFRWTRRRERVPARSSPRSSNAASRSTATGSRTTRWAS